LFTFLTLWLTLHPIVLFLKLPAIKLLKMLAHCANTGMEMLPSFIDNGIDNVLSCRLIHTSPSVAFWIHEHFWTSSVRHTAAWQSDFVLNWLLGPQIWLDGLNQRFFIHFNTYLLVLGQLSPGSAGANIGWGGNLNSRLIVSCVRNICAKILKSGNILQVTISNVRDVFPRSLYMSMHI